mmetsp:Transcript_19895/g.39869  ORF Transcript_19895/g.39869 Transcript_19895/m.39869 type:complete len:610 (-) Transcript_19895:139-1968(-)
MSSLLVIVALIGTLSIRATEALSSPLQHPYSKQPCFSAHRCHSLSFGRASLIPLEAVSERARTDEQISQNDDGDTATTSDKPGSLNTSIGQPHSLTVVAGHGVQTTEEVAEQELWDEILSGDEALDHLDSLHNVIRNEQQETADDQTESNQNHVEDGNTESNVEESESHSSDESEDAAASDIRASLARSAILRRAGVAGGKPKQSSRSKGRSSLARSHVNKNRRGGNEGRAIGQVLSTVRTAAAGSAGRKKLFNNEAEKKDERSTGNNNDLEARATLTVNGSIASTNKWNAAIQSAVSEVLAQPTADELQPPPGTTSMGLLGEVVHETIPVIPPLPGKVLAQRQARLDTAPISIRSSIPHSSDDTHIANLRLSVFSNFDAEKQRAFRHRSVEVINIRRRRGAVVLVAEIPTEEGENHNYLNAMEARIASGHTFGEKRTEPHPGNGAKIRSVSSTIAVADGTNIATIPKQHQQQQYTSKLGNKMIIGSVECSHHEFRGTMLGNSRPKGALMYVTEVAVRPDRRRCGAGAALMKGVVEVAALRNVETIYLHVDVRNKAACAMYERMGYHHLDKREPLYAQFTASLNLHDGAMHGRKHHLMCKHVNDKTTWL